jgi:hypothetical protein
MSLNATVVAAERALPAFGFRWDAETEILAGRCEVPDPPIGFTGAWELESPEGAVVILETVGGVLCGVEVVVWPDLERRPRLAVPHTAPTARLVLAAPAGQASGVLEVESPIAAATIPAETTIHLSFGGAGARTIRVADNVLVDLGAGGQPVGLWLLRLPPFPAEG